MKTTHSILYSRTVINKQSLMLVISNHSAFRVFGKLKYRYSIITHKHRQLPIINNIKFTYKQNLRRNKK